MEPPVLARGEGESFSFGPNTVVLKAARDEPYARLLSSNTS